MLAMVGSGFQNSESETGGLVGGSSHEKSNPPDLIEIRLSQTQMRQDLARSSKISARTIEIRPILDKIRRDTAKSRRDLVEIWPILTIVATPLVSTETDAIPQTQNRTELCFPTIGGGSNFLSPKMVKLVPGWVQI